MYKAPQETGSHCYTSFIQVCVCSGGETRLRPALHCNTIRGLAIEPSLLGILSQQFTVPGKQTAKGKNLKSFLQDFSIFNIVDELTIT